jgi:hypothetical protein
MALGQDDLDAIANAVWNEAYNQHTSAGTFGKLMDILRKSNLSQDGEVASGLSPTTRVFRTNLTETTGAHDSKLLMFTSGVLEGESRPIDTYVSTNGLITLQEALTAAPAVGAEFVVLPQHIHSTQDIAENVRAVGVGVRATQADDGTISLYEGMTYNGTAHAKLSFTVNKNYTAATSITLSIYQPDDTTTAIKTAAASATSSTLIEVTTLTATFSPSLTYEGNPLVAELRYSLIASWSGSLETIAAGRLFVYDTPPIA